ncbi:GNAT family N-acetyltransferase [Sphingomonas oligophenolica]|uniref:GNAT family N-acetyltransferase n=1 Tax=Sphingomonas oligophenolica TaxID=301154 RepID=A0A502CK33_9SPHN|nr:GNAT family N-acetyltransferase [Sphingomonas oligophenolica]TPG13577.1 GNAT family N-acetyltransferase [Sphingomonas oligophenolica]
MIAFRDAVVADADILCELARRTFSDTFGHLYDPGDLAAFLATHTPERWRNELADPAFAIRLAEQDGSAIGYAKLGPPSLPFEPRGASIELRQFYLLAPAQGTGAAQDMMAWVLDTARGRGADNLYLSVFVDNHRARRFYARHGFERIGEYGFMVGNHRDTDDVMRLTL